MGDPTSGNLNAPVDDSDQGRLRQFTAFAHWLAGGHGTARDSIIDHGRTWTGSILPSRMTRGAIGRCYDNAWHTARRSPHLMYVEGFAASGTLGMDLPIEHAWLCDTRTGDIIERTWDCDPARPNLYFGLAIPADIVRQARAISRESVAVIFGDWSRRGWWTDNGLPRAIEATRALPDPLATDQDRP